MSYIGLDVHKSFIEGVVVNVPSRRPLRKFTIGTNKMAISAFARTLNADDKVVLESTVNTAPIVTLLRNNNAEIHVSNPLQTRLIADSKTKTDSIDALALANLLASGYLPTVDQPDSYIDTLRKVVSYNQELLNNIIKVKNRIHSILHRNLVDYSHILDIFARKNRLFLATLSLQDDERYQLGSELGLLDFLDGQVAGIRKQIAIKCLADKDIMRLITIPGIDYYIAVILKSAIGDINRFDSPKKLVSYFGLSPNIRQSAGKCITGRISKRGRSHARWVIVQASQCIVRYPCPLRAFFERLRVKKHRNKAIIAVASKLTRIIWHMLTKEEDYRYSPPLVTREKLGRLRIMAGGKRMMAGRKAGAESKGGREAYLQLRRDDRLVGAKAEEEYVRAVKTKKDTEI